MPSNHDSDSFLKPIADTQTLPRHLRISLDRRTDRHHGGASSWEFDGPRHQGVG